MTVKNPSTCIYCESPLRFNRKTKLYVCCQCNKVSKKMTSRQLEHPVSNLLGGYRLGLKWLMRKL